MNQSTDQVYWRDAGKGNDKIALNSEMLSSQGFILQANTKRKGDTEKENISILYDEEYVIYRLLHLSKKMLVDCTKKQWIALCGQVYTQFEKEYKNETEQ